MPLVIVVGLFALLFQVAPASAAGIHPFKETFGSAAQPTFTNPLSLAVDQPTGALLVVDAGAIKRFNPDGSPADFSALGTNAIDAKKGAGGKPCAEEPSSCDETPENGFVFGSPSEVQVAVDNSGGATNGNIYVTQAGKHLIDIFAADGHYLGQLTKFKEGAVEKAFGEVCGVAVDSAGVVYVGDFSSRVHKFVPSANPPVTGDNTANFSSAGNPCNVGAGAATTTGAIFVAKFATNPVAKFDSAGAVQYSFGSGKIVTVNPANGNVFVTGSNEVATQYDASGASNAAVVSTLTAPGTIRGIAVNGATGDVYVSRTGGTKIEVFSPAVFPPTVVPDPPPTGITPTAATLHGTVNAEGSAVTECKFEYGLTASYGSTAPCAESVPTDLSPHPVSAAIGGLEPEKTYHFRLVAKNSAGTSESPNRTFVTGPRVITESAAPIADTTATLNGSVNPVGKTLTECKFEYGPTEAYGATKDCTPAFGSIPADSSFHAVSADLTGLMPNSTYHFRLVAADSDGPIPPGEDEAFTTLGPPQILEEIAAGVQQSAVTLQAKVNPSGFNTTYHFEWGTDTSYGNRLPLSEDPSIGSGTAPVTVNAPLTGLAAGTSYHFRVVATNSAGTTNGPDYEFITLNAAGLPDNRRFELVSPPDKRPQGAVTNSDAGGTFVTTQVADDGQSVAFPLLGGLADTDSGGDTSYLAKRSASGWQSTKISPPSLVPAPTAGLIGNASSGFVVYNSPDLSCSVINTFNPLTADTPVADVELGVYNLYVRHEDGSNTLITNTVPANPEIEPFGGLGIPITTVAGASSDCGKVYFQSAYKYLSSASGLYEWDEGILRDAGLLPNGDSPIGEVTLGGEFGASDASGSRVNSVSRDGSFFFSATNTAGKKAVFVRKDGTTTVEASANQGGVKDNLGARYETASPDGSHVFFTATYGLTVDSSSGTAEDCSNTKLGSVRECDLYDYDVDSGKLENLSADSNPADSKGAVVQGVIAVSENGSSVYFAARGQLVLGKGKTYAENIIGAGSANVYLARDGQLSYVATIAASDVNSESNVLVRAPRSWTAETTSDGDHLLFASRANVTGYDSGGKPEAYLYSAETGTTRCVSCRPDGLPPSPVDGGVELILSFPSLPGRQSQPRKMSDDGSRVFFTRRDVLAPGAVSGQQNIYEWERGQIHFLVSGKDKVFQKVDFGSVQFYGTSKSGDDVFFSTPAQLDPHDTDFVKDIYDARVGGGFPPPPTSPVPCDPAADQCQGPAVAQPPAPGSASPGVFGPGNPPPPPICGKGKVLRHGKCVRKCPRGKVLRHGKCVRKPDQKKSKQRNHRRAANTNHGGAK